MSLNLAVIGAIVLLILGLSVFGFFRNRTRPALVQLFGAGLLLVMILTHVAEQFRFLRWMGWGNRGTAGHYLDMVSAIGGIALLGAGLTAGLVARLRSARRAER